MCLGERSGVNQFPGWINTWFLPKFHSLIGRHIVSQRVHSNLSAAPKIEIRILKGDDFFQTSGTIVEYSDLSVAKAANLVGCVLACILTVIEIVVLYLVKGMGARLGLVGVFSALFSQCLWLLIDGKVIEVFSATSA